MRGRIVVLAAVAAVAASAPARAAEPTPSQAADRVNQRLFDAQTELVLSGPKAAAADARKAEAAYEGELRAMLARADRDADKAIEDAIEDAATAARHGDRTALAAARGTIRAALFKGAYNVTLDATARGDAKTARRWLLLREFRTATRFTRPGASGTLALDQLASGTLSAKQAERVVEKDLLDAYQARLRELLRDAQRGIEQNLSERRAEASAQANGYFEILAARYAEDRGTAAAESAQRAFSGLPGTLAAAN